MKKFRIIGLAAAALIGSAQINGSFAQTGDKTPPTQSEQKPGPADNQIANDVDAIIAQLKANLRLTVDQEKNWARLADRNARLWNCAVEKRHGKRESPEPS